jgi:hypothetical protein
LRQIEHREATYEVVRNRGDFDRFYFDMYLPYVTNVYGERAFLMGHQEMMSRLDECELFRVWIDGECVAAEVLLYERNRVRGWSVGVKNGDRKYVKAGAIAVLDYLKYRYLQQKGYKYIHLGASRPFLRDGVLRHKSHAGLRIVDDSGQIFMTSCPAVSSPAWTFLENNPFIRKESGQYWGTILTSRDNPPSAETLRSLYRELYVRGLAGLTIYSGEPWPSAPSIPQELEHKINIAAIMANDA